MGLQDIVVIQGGDFGGLVSWSSPIRSRTHSPAVHICLPLVRDFMYMFGQKHVYNEEKHCWDGYYGGNCVDSIDEDYYNMMQQLSKPLGLFLNRL